MAVNFLVRPEKLIAKRAITSGDLTTASTTWVAVPGTRTKFQLGSDSLLEFAITGVLTASGGAARVDLDVAIDGVLVGYNAAPAAVAAGPLGSTNGLLSHDIPAAGKFANFKLADILDSSSLSAPAVAGGVEHSFEMFYRASANSAVINAGAASNPLKYALIEHASAYPPSQAAAY